MDFHSKVPVGAGISSKKPKHFLVVPYSAFGHITPLLELSRRMVAAGHGVTFAVSENLFKDMRTRKIISTATETSIRFVGLVDGVAHTFDENLSVQALTVVCDKLCAVVRDLILHVSSTKSDSRPSLSFGDIPTVDVIVVDTSLNEVPVLSAVECKIPVVAFSPNAAFMTLRMLSVNSDTPVADDDISKQMAPDALPRIFKERLLKAKNALRQTDAIVVNSFSTLESNFHEQMKQCPEFADVKVSFIGPIVTHALDVPEKTAEMTQISRWLDQQEERSVVYVSFGSIATANEQQLREIFGTLESAKRPFIWALRPAQQKLLPPEVQTVLNTQNASSIAVPYLILPWAPQMTILQHKATRLFISHCGWNSTLEGIYSGVPIIGWPMFGDQHGNAELISSSGCGVTIHNVDMSGARLVERDELTGIISSVAQWDKPLSENSYFTTAQRLSMKAAEAISERGESGDAFKFLLSLS